MKESVALYPGERVGPGPSPLLPADYSSAAGFRPRRAPDSNMLVDYWRVVSKWWVVILGCSVAGALLSVALTLGVLPVYRARTSLNIQSINSDFLNMRNVAPTGDGNQLSGDSYVQTQIKLLQSTTVLDRTVERLKAQPHPASIQKTDLISNTRRSLGLPGGELAYAALLDDAAKRVAIKPLGITQLVEVTCDSWDAKFSATFCNTLTEEFKAIDLETRASEAEKTSEFLTRQVADVRRKAEASQQKLEEATGGDGLALSQESNSVGEDRLRQLQAEMVRAEADRIEKESQLQTALTSPPNSISAALDSPIYREYQQKLADLNSRVAEVVPPLTEENPKVIHLRSQIREVQDGMARSRAEIIERLRNDFQSATRHQSLLEAAYGNTQHSVSNEMNKTERVNLLRREVDSEQQLYQTLLQHAKEAGFASAMQTTTIRVVDAAKAPKIPISPRRGGAIEIGLLLGTMCGIAFAFVRDRTANVFQLPGEAERHLRVHELGVIPSNSVGLGSQQKPPSPRKRELSLSLKAAEIQPPALACWSRSFSVVAEAYRNATHSLLLAGEGGRESRAYIVSSPNCGEGKTTVTTNLGVGLSKSKMRAVVIDGDLRRSALHQKLMLENTFGLRNILREEIDVSSAPLGDFCKPTTISNLSIITAGTGKEEVVELLHSKAAGRLIERLRREFDVILIDTPPMLHMADARIFASQTDGVILVFRASVTNREDAEAVCDLLEHDHVPVIGTILNDFNPSKQGKRGYYHSYFQYWEDADSSKAEEVVKC